ncbi:MAG: hypothetical protein DA405_00730 [Bacteroidetes bacterium]|nr:MAG: hypothetical protein DA405_00730 [Bacteroidota bacterium]
MQDMIDLVIGSNSYLGINLCRILDPRKTLLVSKRSNDKLNRAFTFLPCDLREFKIEISEQVSRVFILARSNSPKKEDQISFYQNLEASILLLAAQNVDLEIHFISTSLVYASHEYEPYDKHTIAAPEDLYEKMKLDFEKWLYSLISWHKGMKLRVYRIPLLIGGYLRSADRERQLFYAFYNDIRQGNLWFFSTPESKHYGTAWLDVEVLCTQMIIADEAKGYHSYLPFSGNLSYYQFMRQAHKRLMFPAMRSRSLPPASFMQMASEDQWGKEDFWTVFKV